MRNIAVVLSRIACVVIVTAIAAQSSVPSGPARAAALAGRATEAMPGFEETTPPVPVPDVRFADAGGRPLTLADFRGRVVLLNFWATWCAPCVREMPSLDRLQARLGGPEFEVVALSLDRGGAALVTPFFERLGITHLRQYLDTSSRSSTAFGVRGLPTTVLIDRDGRELGRVSGPAEWDSEAAIAFIGSHLEGAITTTGSFD